MPSASERPGLGDLLKSAAIGAYSGLRFGVPYAIEKNLNTATPEDDKYYQAWLNYRAQQAQAAAPTGPAGLDDIAPFGIGGGPGKVGLGRAFLENLTYSAPYMAAGLVGGAAGALAGGPAGAAVGAVAAGTPQFIGTNTQRAVEDGEFTADEAAKAVAYAPVQAGMDVLVGRYVPGLGKAFGVGAARQSGNLVKRMAASAVKAAAVEAVTETAQQALERNAAGLDLTSPEAQKELVSAFAIGGLLGGGLGALGGVRKKPGETTNEDLTQHVDTQLAGYLPAPSAFTDSAGRTVVGAGGIDELARTPRPSDVLDLTSEQMVPEGTTQRLLESNPTLFGQDGRPPGTQLQMAPPDVREALWQMPSGDLLEAADRLTKSDQFGEREQGMFSLIWQELEAREQGVPKPQLTDQSTTFVDPAGRATTTLAPDPVDELQRPLREVPGGDLQVAYERATETDNMDMVTAIEREMEARRRDPSLNPVEPTAEEKLAAARKGINNKFIASLGGIKDEEQLLGRVYDQIFVEQDVTPTTQKLAQRLGILDENLAPTALAEQVRARQEERAAATPVADGVSLADTRQVMSFANKDVDARKMQIAMMGRDDRKALETQVLKVMGISPIAEGRDAAAVDKATNRALETRDTKLEQAAREMGLIKANGELSARGRLAAARIPEKTETTIEAATSRGFTGAAAAMFERGANGVEVRKFDTLSDAAAYKAGLEWKVPLTVDQQKTRDVLYGKEGTKKRGALARKKADKVERGRVDSLTPEQDRQQRFLQALDEYPLPAGRDADKRAIRQMILDGKSNEEIDEAANRVREGKTLFVQTESARPETEGVRFSAAEKRAIRARANVKKIDGKKLATRVILVRESLEAAKDSGDISARDFMAAIVRLSAGDIPGAVAFLPGQIQAQLGSDYQPETEVQSAIKFQRRLQGDKNLFSDEPIAFSHVLKVMRDEAPSTFHRVLMARITSMVTKLERQGLKFHFRVVRTGSLVNEVLAKPRVRATTGRSFDGQITVEVKGVDFALNGMRYETIAHELVHAVTVSIIRWTRGRRGVGRAFKAAQDLRDLTKVIQTHLANRKRSGAPLTELEQNIDKQLTNALADPDEVIAWGLTNKEVQEYLNSVDFNPQMTLWQRFVNLLGELLGIPVRYGSALERLMQVSEELLDLNVNEISEVLTASDGQTVALSDGSPQTLAQMDGAIRDTVSQLNAATERVLGAKVQPRNASWLLGVMSFHHMAEQYGDILPSLRKVEAAHGERQAIETRFAQLIQILDDRRAEMLAKNPKLGDTLNKLMELTEFEIDPTRAWDDQPHLHTRANVDKLKELHRAGGQHYKNLRDAGFSDLYDNLRMVNEANSYASLSMLLHNLIAVSPQLSSEIPGMDTNPVDRFSADAALHGDPAAAQKYWKATLENQMEASTAFIRQLRGEVVGRGRATELNNMLSPIETQLRATREHINALNRAPYFHLGRFGNYFVSFSVKTGKGGVVDPDALDAVAEAIEAANLGADIRISRDSTQSSVYIRVETDLARERIEQIAEGLKGRQLLDPEVEIKGGLRAAAVNVGRGAPEASLDHLVQAVAASPLFVVDKDASKEEREDVEFRKEQLLATMRGIWLDTLPDIAMAKVRTRRKSVLGYSGDMFRAYAHRAQISAKAIAGLATTPKFNAAFTEMRATANDSLLVSSPNHANTNLVHRVYREAVSREAKNAEELNAVGVFDKARAVTHGWFLGLSPAYFLLNLTQMGVMLWPQLGAKHGFVESARAMAKVTPIAFKILKAQAVESLAKSQKGVRGRVETAGRVSDVTITMQSLKKAGVSQADTTFIMNMLAKGTIDLGSAARELAQLSEPATTEAGKNLDVALKIGASFGLYSETFNRLVSALAARELYKDGKVKGQTVEDYAASIVDETMFNYSQTNTASLLGRRGIMGQVTPLVTQFMQYSLQATEKLYREFYTSIKGGAEEKAIARRFLAGHAAAVMALAGALGLPFATVIASMIERTVDLFDDDETPFDATAALRNFFADTFGPELGEIISRGGPRALGFDLSSRAGEQDLLPFSKFLADRRAWKDSANAQLTTITGPSGSALNDFFEGVGKIMDGNFMQGSVQVLPTFLRNPIKTYSMSEKGYTDREGNKLPMSPTAAAYLAQVLGFTPAAKAEETERQGDQRSRKGIVTREATILRNKIVQAILAGDGATARDAIRDAQSFDADNPGFEVLPDIESAVKRRLRNQAIAQMTNTPIGISPKDLAGQTMTRYANVN